MRILKKILAAMLVLIMVVTAEQGAFIVLAEEIGSLQVVEVDLPFYVTKDDYIKTKHIKRLKEDENEYMTVFENEDGTISVYSFATPIQYRDSNGELVDYDPRLKEIKDNEKKNAGYVYEVTSSDVSIMMPEDLVSDKYLSIEKDKYKIDFKPIASVEEKDKNNNEAEEKYKAIKIKDDIKEKNDFIGVAYQSSDDNISYKYYASNTGIKEDIILKSAPDTNVLQFEIKVKNIIPTINAGGSIDLLDENTKEVIGEMPPFFMYDSYQGDEYKEGDIHYSENVDIEINQDKNNKNKYILTVYLDEKMLYSESTVYPIIVDPYFSLTGPASILDSYICENRPTVNYSSSVSLFVGRSVYGRHRSYVKFVYPTNYSPYNIERAIYRTVVYKDYYAAYASTVELYKVIEDWNANTITWNSGGNCDWSNIVDTVQIFGQGPYYFDVKDLVQDWALYDMSGGQEGSPDYGFMLKETSENDNKRFRYLGSANNSYYIPYIGITYNQDNEAPNDVASLSASANAGALGSGVGTVTMSWPETTDLPSWNNVGVDEYELKLFEGNIGSSTQVGSTVAVNHDGSANYTYTFTDLDDNKTYYGEIRAKDNAGNYSGITASYQVILADVSGPSAPTMLAIDSTDWTEDTTPTISWSGIEDDPDATANVDIEYSINEGDWTDSTWDGSNGTGTFDSSLFTNDGIYTIAIRGKDALGNIGESSFVEYKLDTAAPSISIQTPLTIETDDTVDIVGSALDDTSGIGSWSLDYGVGENPSNWVVPVLTSGTDGMEAGTAIFTWDVSALLTGYYTVRLTAIDNTGNQSVVTEGLFIDREPPTVEIQNPINNSNVNGNVEIWGTCTDGSYDSMASYVLEINRHDSFDTFIETIVLESGINCFYENELIYTLNTSSFNQGDRLYIHLSAADKVGNTTEDTVLVTIEQTIMSLENMIVIEPEAGGIIADQEQELVSYTRNGDAQGTLETINLFVDGSLFINQTALNDIFFETLRYLENSQHSIALIGENSNGEYEYCQGLTKEIVDALTADTNSISTYDNISFVSGGIELTDPSTSGYAIFNEITLSQLGLTYLFNASYSAPAGTGVQISVSFDNGATWIEVDDNVESILEDDSTSMLIKISLSGDGTLSPTVMGVQVQCVFQQTPYYVTVKTVDEVTNLSAITNNLGQVNVVWDDSIDTNVRYNVYKATESEFIPDETNKVANQLENSTYDDNDVTPGVTYYYQVIATKIFTSSDPEDIVFRESEPVIVGATPWGNTEEIEAAQNANQLYDNNTTVQYTEESPSNYAEIKQSSTGERPQCASGFEPVNFVTGNFYVEHLDAMYSALPDVNSSVLRTYNAQSEELNGPFGNGWAWYYSMHLKLYSDGDIGMIQPDGHLVMFRLQADGTYANDEDELMSLNKSDTEHIVTNHYGDQIAFDSGGQLKRIVSNNGNTTYITYDANGIIDQVIFDTGKIIEITTDTDGHITEIVLPDGRSMSYVYLEDNLVEFHDIADNITTYTYDILERMEAWFDKEGNRQVFNVYDSQDRVIEQWDATGAYYQLSYGATSITTTNGENDSEEYFYDSMGRTTKIVDALGNTQEYEYNDNNQVTMYTDKAGIVTTYEYENNNLVKEITTYNDGSYRERNYTYDSNSNLTGESDYLGNWTIYEYVNNNLTKKIYPDGSTYIYVYNANSQLETVENPLGDIEHYNYQGGENLREYTDYKGNVTKYDYYDNSNLKTITDANNGVTTFEYDQYGNVNKIILPDNTYTNYLYDSTGNIIEAYDAKGQLTSYEYDELGHIKKMISPDLTETLYVYDNNGNLKKLTYSDGTYVEYYYDAIGNLLSITDRDGKIYSQTYTPTGNVGSITSPNLTVTSLTYYAGTDWLKKVEDGDLNAIEYIYDANGNIEQIVYANGTTVDYTYDVMGRIKKEILNNGATTTYNYNILGQLESVVDPMGYYTWYSYDKIGKLETITNTLGQTTTITYDCVGNMKTITDANGNTTTYNYDSVNMLRKIISSSGSIEEYSYDANGQLENVITALGGTINNVYNEMGRLDESTDLLGATTSYHYNSMGYLETKTNALGNVYTYDYYDDGNLESVTDPLGNVVSYEFNSMGSISKIIGEEGFYEIYEYDNLNQLVRVTDSEGYVVDYEYNNMGQLVVKSDNTGKSTTYTYSIIGQIKTITNAKGEKTELFYDLNGNVIRILYADGTDEEYQYNHINQLEHYYDRNGLETKYEYDGIGNVLKVTRPSNKVYQYEYDDNYNITKEINPLGGETIYTYDDAGNVTSVTDPMGNVIQIQYNSAGMIDTVIDALDNQVLDVDYTILGEVESETNALGYTTQYSYDELSRLTQVTDPLGKITQYGYDGASNLASVIDANSHTTLYGYNTIGLLTSETSALGYVENYEYYVDGLLKKITQADNTTSNYAYDVAGRLTDITYSDGTSVEYGYNEVGSTTTMTDITGITTYQYDDMQQLISVTDVYNKTVGYVYDILGRETSITLPDGQIINYEYDLLDRMTRVYDDTETIASYTYDANSQLLTNTRGDITTTYDYNEFGQIETLTTTKLQQNIMQFDYQYDDIGNIVSEVRTEGSNVNTRAYTYDAANQLTSFTDNSYTETYTYDNVGNRLTKDINGVTTSYSYNAGNQLTQETTNGQTIGYTYNANGDLASKTTGEVYSYNILGKLTSIQGNGLDKKYTYNGNGTLLKEETNGYEVFFTTDINRRYEEVLQTTNEDGVVYDTYIYGLQRIKSEGLHDEVYLYDGRGSVVGSVEQCGQVTSYSYTAYGELMPSSPQPTVFGFNGEATDFDTGMQYLRARNYDASIGRFFQKDDYKGDLLLPRTLNRFIYAICNPVLYYDPSGYKSIADYDEDIRELTALRDRYRTLAKNYVIKSGTYEELARISFGALKIANGIKYIVESKKQWDLGQKASITANELSDKITALRNKQALMAADEARKQAKIQEINDARKKKIEEQKVARAEEAAAAMLRAQSSSSNNNKIPSAESPQDASDEDGACNASGDLRYPEDYPRGFVNLIEERKILAAKRDKLEGEIDDLNNEIEKLKQKILQRKAERKMIKVSIAWEEIDGITFVSILYGGISVVYGLEEFLAMGYSPTLGEDTASFIMDIDDLIINNNEKSDLWWEITGYEGRLEEIEDWILPSRRNELSNITTFNAEAVFLPTIRSIDNKLQRKYPDYLAEYTKIYGDLD